MAPYLEMVKVIFPISFSIHDRCSLNLKSFTDVPVADECVDTVQFLLASEGLVGMFGMFIH
jgi:hypothetical protein